MINRKILEQLDESDLTNIIRHSKLLKKGAEKDKLQIVKASTIATDLQNGFNKLEAFATNIKNIHKAQTEASDFEKKAGTLSKGMSAPPAVPEHRDTILALQHLTAKVEELALLIQGGGLNLSGNDSAQGEQEQSSGIGSAVRTGVQLAGLAAIAVASHSASHDADDSVPAESPPETFTVPKATTADVINTTTPKSKSTSDKKQKEYADLTKKAVHAKSERKEGPTSDSSKGWGSQFASWLGKTFKSISSYVSKLPQTLASMASGAWDAMGGWGNNLMDGIDTIASGGAAADMEQTIDRAGIKDPVMKAQIMAQTAHESMGFTRTTEMGDRSYFQKYEGRKDLGNTQPGDGYRYRGRGFIQITGRANYAEMSKELGVDLIRNPDILSTPKYASVSALAWLRKRSSRIKNWADTRQVTEVVNGGQRGINDRQRYFSKYLGMYRRGESVSQGFAGTVQSGRTTVSGLRDTATDFVDTISNIPGNLLNFIRLKDSSVNLNVQPLVLRRFKAMAYEYNQRTEGKKLQVNSGLRTFKEQAYLWRTMPPGRAARPGTSRHESGFALDLQSADVNSLQKLGLLQKYGFYKAVRGEDWHIEPVETSRMKRLAKGEETDGRGRPLAVAGGRGRGQFIGTGGARPAPIPSRRVALQGRGIGTVPAVRVDSCTCPLPAVAAETAAKKKKKPQQVIVVTPRESDRRDIATALVGSSSRMPSTKGPSDPSKDYRLYFGV